MNFKQIALYALFLCTSVLQINFVGAMAPDEVELNMFDNFFIPFTHTIENDNEEQFSQLIMHVFSSNLIPQKACKFIEYIIKHDAVKCLEVAYESNLFGNFFDHYNPIEEAIKHTANDCFVFLIENAFEKRTQVFNRSNGSTIFHLAVEHKNEFVIWYMRKNFPELAISFMHKTNYTGKTPIELAMSTLDPNSDFLDVLDVDIPGTKPSCAKKLNFDSEDEEAI